jgi:hypothetical protein
MPIKKKTTAAKKPAVLGPKAKLMKLAVTTLRNKAKKLGVSDVSKRTKENLVQSIILGEARKKRGTAAGKKATAKRAVSKVRQSTRQTGTSKLTRDLKKRAFPPGRRVSKAGNVYYERRRNRSDKPGQLAGYNGWANWSTWNANLWDGEVFYEMIQDAKDSGDDKMEVAAMLEGYYNDAAESLGAQGFFSDVISSAVNEIDWEEIVESHWEE